MDGKDRWHVLQHLSVRIRAHSAAQFTTTFSSPGLRAQVMGVGQGGPPWLREGLCHTAGQGKIALVYTVKEIHKETNVSV